jgi:hypothetical protein
MLDGLVLEFIWFERDIKEEDIIVKLSRKRRHQS